MPNTQAPFGFRQFSGLGSAPTYEQVAVAITYTAGAIYYGDPVVPLADGSVAQAGSTTTTPATTSAIAGIFQGCKYLSVAQKRTVWGNYWPGSDAVAGSVEGYIINDPNARFVAQTDGTGLALVDVNGTIGFLIGSGNAANGLSGAYLDTATLNLGATYGPLSPFRIVSLVNFPPGAQGTLSNGQIYDWAVVAFNYVATKNFLGV